MARDHRGNAAATVSSSTEVPWPAQERRAARRLPTIYCAAVIRTAKVQALCRIRDLSAGGMMGRVHAALPVGETLHVEIRSGEAIAGTVAWADGELIGVRFSVPIDVMAILRPSGGAGLVQRMPRLYLPCEADLYVDGLDYRVAVMDVSQGGAKIETQFLEIGDKVVIRVDGMGPYHGHICWARGRRAGICFAAPIPFDTLARWAVERQARPGETAH